MRAAELKRKPAGALAQIPRSGMPASEGQQFLRSRGAPVA